ncbi:MAG: leucine-rich repeat domain-containing protein [Lachnospiraceae bacterium]|nr:leucine-rich repeat domain-containing protein [Lachnospiraceae bacterium]
MEAYYSDGRGRYGTGESYDYFWQYEDETMEICTSLDGLWTYIETDDGISLLRYNGNQTHIDIPAAVDGKKTVALECTFDGFYELKSVTVPEGIITLSGGFYGCEGLEIVSLPQSIRDLEHAFDCCYSLKNLVIPPHVKYFDYAFSGTRIETMEFPEGAEDISHSFIDSHLKSVFIPKSVTTLYEAFKGCEDLEHVVIEEGVRSIDDYAFYHCLSLQELMIPESVVQFGKRSVGYMEIREYLHPDKSAYRMKGEQIIPGFKIRGIPGSAAERYAKDNGIMFAEVTDK